MMLTMILNIMFATNDVTFDSGFGLNVWGGDTYIPGGTVTTQGGGDVHINTSATFNAAGNAVADNGYWDNDGTYSTTTNTTTFNATTTNQAVNGAGFDDVVFNGSGGEWDLNTFTAGGNLTVTTGIVDGTDNNPDVTVTGNFVCDDTINTGTGTWEVAGNVDLEDCTLTATTGNTLKMTGTSNTITPNPGADPLGAPIAILTGTVLSNDASDFANNATDLAWKFLVALVIIQIIFHIPVLIRLD